VKVRILAVLVLLASTSAVQAATVLDAGFTDSTYATGVSGATAMAFAPDGRLFVCQQTGALRVIKNGVLLTQPFTTVSVDSANERGLLGVTFDPAFATNGWVYIYYTTPQNGVHNRISRFTASGDVAVAGSEVVIVELPPLSSAANHNGGALHFAADGTLFVAVGDNATGSNSQSFSTTLGKMLRFGKDGSIPTDNPFYGSTTGQNRAIWALGLRNPFNFAIRRMTGALMINDVGGGGWEEVNVGQRGANYGWPATEGYTTNPAYKSPLYAYPHAGGTDGGCAITGATFYDPQTAQFPASYVGLYFFGDHCNGWMRRLDPSNGSQSVFATGISGLVDIRVGPDGALYYLARGANAVGRISYSQAQAPTITSHPANASVPVGGSATFEVSASGSLPFT
jgi:glucose/arabinose dehydrogenase